MNNLKKYNEDWNPGKDAFDTDKYLFFDNELKDESTIQQFVDYHGLNPLIVDIWKYAKSEFKSYPSKITQRGMVYGGKGSTKIELEFGKNEIILWHIKLVATHDRHNPFDSKLIKSGKFSYKLFKQMINYDYE